VVLQQCRLSITLQNAVLYFANPNCNRNETVLCRFCLLRWGLLFHVQQRRLANLYDDARHKSNQRLSSVRRRLHGRANLATRPRKFIYRTDALQARHVGQPAELQTLPGRGGRGSDSLGLLVADDKELGHTPLVLMVFGDGPS